MNKIYAEYFLTRLQPGQRSEWPSCQALLSKSNVVAVRDSSSKKAVFRLPADTPDEPVSPGILTNDRLFISAMRGRHMTGGQCHKIQRNRSVLHWTGVKAVVEAARLHMANVVFVNPYLTGQIPMAIMNGLYAKRFEFGNTPAREPSSVTSRPENSQIESHGTVRSRPEEETGHRLQDMKPSPSQALFFADGRCTVPLKADLSPDHTAGCLRLTWSYSCVRPCEICSTISRRQA